MGFQLYLPSECNTINEFHEGVEFSVRLGTEGAWIPIVLNIRSNFVLESTRITIGNVEGLTIRGYPVTTREIPVNGARGIPYSVQICDFDEQFTSVQFRWLQTSGFNSDPRPKDVWAIDDIRVSYEPQMGDTMELLRDSFDGDVLK